MDDVNNIYEDHVSLETEDSFNDSVKNMFLSSAFRRKTQRSFNIIQPQQVREAGTAQHIKPKSEDTENNLHLF